MIRSSICTGEQVAGFRDLRSGRFTEIMLVRDNEDIEEFTKKYGISREEIRREW
ncbi:MAG: aspartate dehydrogenase [Acetatifactor sp.]|nr:aspartate dehydrogenase [Acetatifactor sp.]